MPCRQEEAIGAFDNAAAFWRRIQGDDGWRVGIETLNAATARTKLGDTQRALADYERVRVIEEKVFGLEHPLLAAVHAGIAYALEEQLTLPEAEAHYRLAVSIAEKALGRENPELADYLDGLGEVLSFQGRYRAALPYHERALSIREHSYPSDHPLLATSLEGFARADVGLGDAPAAIPYAERALRRT